MDFEDILAALGGAGGDFPRAAMQAALDRWDEAGPRFLAMLAAYEAGADRSEQTERALFFAIHLLAERGETAAFAPLCRLLADAEISDLLLGDAIAVTLPSVLVSLFDGDARPLRALVEAEGADEIARHNALRALTYLTAVERVSELELRTFLTRSRADMRPQGESFVWAAWVMAVIDLGWRDMAREAAALCRDGFVATEWMRPENVKEGLISVLGNPDRLAPFAEDGLGPLESAVEAIEALYADAEDDDVFDDAVQEPVTNPLRHVGRNDPCPCGSGRKYKKCCLP